MLNKNILSALLFAPAICLADQIIVLQPGPSDGKDTYYGTYYEKKGNPDFYELRHGGWGDAYFDFIEFDLTGAPPANVVQTVWLYLYAKATRPTDPEIDVHRITEHWEEGAVSYYSYPASVSFTRMDRINEGWNAVDITDLYKGWQNGIYQNYGIKLSPNSTRESNGAFVSSDDTVNPELRPKLVISYEIPPASLRPFRSPFTESVELSRVTQPHACLDCTSIFPDRYHAGIDMVPSNGDPTIRAVETGKVCRILKHGVDGRGYGNAIIIEHPSGIATMYAHLADVPKNSDGTPLVKYEEGTSDYELSVIAKGSEIGKMGNTGIGDGGDHLHFALGQRCPTSGSLPIGYPPEHPSLYGILDPWDYFEVNSLPFLTPITVQRDPLQGMRTGPNTSSMFYEPNLLKGQTVVATAKVDGWYKVDVPCGQKTGVSNFDYKGCSGWLKAVDGSCSPNGSCVTEDLSKSIITPTEDAVNVRNAPGTINDVLTGSSGLADYPMRFWKGQYAAVKVDLTVGEDLKSAIGRDLKSADCPSDLWYGIDVTDDTGQSTGWVCSDFVTEVSY